MVAYASPVVAQPSPSRRATPAVSRTLKPWTAEA